MNPLNDYSASESKLNLDEFKNRQQNLPLAVIAGSIAAIVSAIVWAAITVVTEMQIGWMAIGVGALVGFGVRLGKGVDNMYRNIGAALALLGCILGNFFTFIGFFAKTAEISPFTVLSVIDYAKVPSIMIEMGSPIDLLFYGIAIFQGYKLAVKSDAVAVAEEIPPTA